MQHEKIIKMDDGAKIKIRVTLFVDINKLYWNSCCEICPSGKRKFTDVLTGNLYHMQLTEEERLGYFAQLNLTEDIKTAKLELWNKIKPE